MAFTRWLVLSGLAVVAILVVGPHHGGPVGGPEVAVPSWAHVAPEQIAEAVRINSETRLRALKTGFIVLAGLSILALVPCGWLPDYRPGQIPAESKSKKA